MTETPQAEPATTSAPTPAKTADDANVAPTAPTPADVDSSQPVTSTESDGTVVTAYPDGTVRRDNVGQTTQTFPYLNLTVKTSAYSDLLAELDNLVTKLKQIDGSAPATFTAVLTNNGSSYVNYQLAQS